MKIHYRIASFVGPDTGQGPPKTFEEVVRATMLGDLGKNYASRMLSIHAGRPDKALVNQFNVEAPGVLLQLYHLDIRRSLTFIQRQTGGIAAVASILSRPVPDDEDAMGPDAYLFALGNHVATIEPFALRVGAIQSYMNGLFQHGALLQAGEYWRLDPRVEIGGGGKAARGVTRVEISPIARLVGEGPSRLPAEGRTKSKPSERTETRMAHGQKVVALLEFLGASEADLGDIRSSLSADLGLEATVDIKVTRNRKKTDARLERGDIEKALAALEEDNDVSIVSPDGKTKGKVSTLWKMADIAEEVGELSMKNVAAALTSALNDWAAQGIIDLSGLHPS